MQADVERFTYSLGKHYLRVFEQQGRVALAADGNEQAAILLAYLQTLARDLIGPYGTAGNADGTHPADDFQVSFSDNMLVVHTGHYWVDGLVCETDDDFLASSDAAPPPDPETYPDAGHALVYLDAWERHVAAAQDESIRDVALGGPDTCSRSKVVWQLRLLTVEGPLPTAAELHAHWSEDWLPKLEPAERGDLAVKVDDAAGPPDPCQAPPGSGYFGAENQLYRVEVQRGSGEKDDAGNALPATFKWSRNNGSVIYPLAEIDGTAATLRDPPFDCRTELAHGTLVEIVDDYVARIGLPGPLARVVTVEDDEDDVIIHLDEGTSEKITVERHPLLRRWDHPDVDGGGELPTRATDAALDIVESDDQWLTLEDGIQIRFAKTGAEYRSGDYWTVPARVATGNVTWPRADDGTPLPTPPHGIEHHFAPLAFVAFVGNKLDGTPTDLRLGIAPTATLLPA
jgi:uncharacterized protein DUF6519